MCRHRPQLPPLPERRRDVGGESDGGVQERGGGEEGNRRFRPAGSWGEEDQGGGVRGEQGEEEGVRRVGLVGKEPAHHPASEVEDDEEEVGPEKELSVQKNVKEE